MKLKTARIRQKISLNKQGRIVHRSGLNFFLNELIFSILQIYIFENVYFGKYRLKIVEKNNIQKFVYFYLKDFIFHKYTCKMYILTDI